MLATSTRERNAGINHKLFPRDNGKFLCYVELDKIQVADYQREISTRHIAEIQANYNSLAEKPVTVSFRDGILWVVDGNHTLKNMINMGQTLRQVECVFGMTYEQEAELFFDMNNITKRMTPTVSFNSAIKAGKAKENAIAKILEECKVHTTLTDKKEADIRSFSVLYDAFELDHGSPNLLRHFLKCLKRTWKISNKNPLVQAEARNIQFQRGLLDFLVKHPTVKANDFVRIFKNHTASNIQMIALDITAQSGTARADKKQVREALEYIYKMNTTEIPTRRTKQGKSRKILSKILSMM